MRISPFYFLGSLAAIAAVTGLALYQAHHTQSPAETESSLRVLLAANPHNAAAAEHLADILAHRNQNQEAISLYQSAMKNAPDNASAPVSLALLLDKAGQSVAANRLLEDNLKRHPTDAATNEALADLTLKTLGDLAPTAYPRIKPLYQTALQSEPTRASAALSLAKIDLAQGSAPAARKVLETALADGANSRNSALHLALAKVLGLLHDYSGAGPQFDAGTALDPANAQAFCDWGIMLIDAGKPELAEKILRHAVELAPKNPAFHMHLGRALREQGRYGDSRDEFEAAIRADENYAPTYLEASRSLLNMHQEPDAIAYLRKAMQIDPSYAEAKVALAKIYSDPADESDRNPLAAASLLEEAVDDTRGQDLSLLVACAKAMDAVGADDQAVDKINAALALGQVRRLTPAQHETLLQLQQNYTLAALPPASGKVPSFLALQFLGGTDPLAQPDPPLPSFADQFWRPIDITRAPFPGSAADPELYLRAAEMAAGHGDALGAGDPP